VPTTVFEVVGGVAFFEALTERFYASVAADPVLLRVYPTPEDLEPARRHLALFLAEYWGGPPDYLNERGAPRLRMRHEAFEIGPGERDRWLAHMRDTITALNPPPEARDAMLEYFRMAADALRNRD